MSLRKFAINSQATLQELGGIRLNRNFLAKYNFKLLIKRKMSTNIDDGKKSIVAVAQMCSTSNKEKNLQQVTKIVALAKESSAKFLFLPECCDFVGDNRQQTLDLSEPLIGPTVGAYKELAKANKIWISAGGVHESVFNQDGKKTDKINNAHIVINDCGEIVTIYRKLHLFDVITPSFRFRESDVVSQGQAIVAPLTTPIGNIGLQICYDVRFAEVSTILRKCGADILTYPSAFAYSTGRAHWDILMRARAIENQCYVISAAQIGFHNEKRQSYGHAMIADPWGEVIASCDDRDLDVAVAHIDLTAMEKIRTSMPCFDHRRNDIYSLVPIELTAATKHTDGGKDRYFADHRIPIETIFYESQHCYAFTNLRCVVQGHVLVATKRIVPRLKDLNCDEISDLFQSVCKIQMLLESIYNTSAATVTVQDGTDAGQTVRHVHFHVMPRRKGDFEHNDQIYIELQRVENSTETRNRNLSEMVEEAQLYREYLRKGRNYAN